MELFFRLNIDHVCWAAWQSILMAPGDAIGNKNEYFIIYDNARLFTLNFSQMQVYDLRWSARRLQRCGCLQMSVMR